MHQNMVLTYITEQRGVSLFIKNLNIKYLTVIWFTLIHPQAWSYLTINFKPYILYIIYIYIIYIISPKHSSEKRDLSMAKFHQSQLDCKQGDRKYLCCKLWLKVKARY